MHFSAGGILPVLFGQGGIPILLVAQLALKQGLCRGLINQTLTKIDDKNVCLTKTQNTVA